MNINSPLIISVFSGYLYSPVPSKWLPDNSGRYTPGVNGGKQGYVKRAPQHYEVHSSGW